MQRRLGYAPTMAERWWDPQSEPVPLLEPTGDTRLSLANALVQVHRCGGAALMAAAQTPLVDAHTIAESLVASREAYAPEVLTFVGETLGDPIYAGLLVRDVADAAETTSLRMYQACVSKGVSPPVAAERVAAVYGVPGAQLGPYAAMAIEPNAKPVALTDAADRALFGWVARTSTDETEVVSKAESPARRRELAEKERRGEHGRWATTIEGQPTEDWINAQLRGGTTVGPEEVATPVKEPTRLAPVVRRHRKESRKHQEMRDRGVLVPSDPHPRFARSAGPGPA